MSSAIAVAAAGPEHLAGIEALFEAAGTPCYCRYYHFEGTNNEWLARCSDGQGENRREFAAALAARTDEARGVVALAQGATDVIGWLKVAPAAAVAKAYERRLYRGLPCFAGDRAGVFLIGCAVVHPRHRRQGVATALVAGAVELAPAWGARALEALPRRPREPVSDEELWTGPVSAFTRNGFVEVHAFEPYPVLRRTL
ncbi:GNAT family N-acetyltransferase [Sorangium sp. So ce542]|uniref:GNAT family N-acetyltransferase n=1 Tax=Sorangium sp. So ce542 TaxID=3133316 RepID=UPI003F630B41